MNLSSKFLQDVNGTNFAPITTPNAVRWPDGSNLEDKLQPALSNNIEIFPIVNAIASINNVGTSRGTLGNIYYEQSSGHFYQSTKTWNGVLYTYQWTQINPVDWDTFFVFSSSNYYLVENGVVSANAVNIFNTSCYLIDFRGGDSRCIFKYDGASMLGAFVGYCTGDVITDSRYQPAANILPNLVNSHDYYIDGGILHVNTNMGNITCVSSTDDISAVYWSTLHYGHIITIDIFNGTENGNNENTGDISVSMSRDYQFRNTYNGEDISLSIPYRCHGEISVLQTSYTFVRAA